jgi:hypothetical protein
MQMAISFIAGIVITIALAQMPFAAEIFSPGSSHETIVPALPDTPDHTKPSASPDTTKPVKFRIRELVYTSGAEVVSLL